MDKSNDPQEYLALKYEVRILRDGDAYVLGIPELALRERGADLPTVYARLMAKRDELLTELVNEGLEAWIIPPGAVRGGGGVDAHSGPVQAGSLVAQLRPFFVKLVVVLGLLAVLGIAIGNVVSGVGRGIDRDFAKIRTWPDDKTEQMRKNTHDTLVKLKPILDEVRAAMADPKQEVAPAKKP